MYIIKILNIIIRKATKKFTKRRKISDEIDDFKFIIILL